MIVRLQDLKKSPPNQSLHCTFLKSCTKITQLLEIKILFTKKIKKEHSQITIANTQVCKSALRKVTKNYTKSKIIRQ